MEYRIAHLRRQMNMNQVELAKVLGTSQTNLSKIELGKTNLYFRMAYKISIIFDIPMEELIKK